MRGRGLAAALSAGAACAAIAVGGIAGAAEAVDSEDLEAGDATDISLGKVILDRYSYTYTGKRIAPKATVTSLEGTVLREGVDYVVRYQRYSVDDDDDEFYSHMKGVPEKVGRYCVAVRGVGSYTNANSSDDFVIHPKGTSIRKSEGQERSLALVWNRQKAQASGYQIRYSTKKGFGTGSRSVTVEGAKKTGKTITGLAPKRNYYVKVRVYKNAQGAVYYSKWSKVKRVKTS